MWDPYSEFEKIVLDNGLTVYAAHWPGRPWEAVEFVVHCGAKEDPSGLEGTAHFVEHLVSDNIPGLSHEDAETFFEEHGAYVGFGATGYLATKYNFLVGQAELPKALEIFGRMLLEGRLQNKVEHHRAVITDEFHNNYPNSIIFDLRRRCKSSIFAKHPQLDGNITSLGTLETISKISADGLQKFYDQYYVPENISIAVVGGLTVEEIRKYFLTSPFAQKKDGQRNALVLPAAEVGKPTVTKEIFSFSSYTNLAIPPGLTIQAALPGIISGFALSIFSQIVYDLLFERIRREKGWTYGINRAHSWYQDYHEQIFTIPAFQLDALDVIEAEVNCCLKINDRFADLLEKKKKQRIASYWLTDVSAFKLAEYSGDDLETDQRIITLAEAITNVQAITLEDMKVIMRHFQPENRLTLLMKP